MTVDELFEHLRRVKELPPPDERKRRRVDAGVSLREAAAALGVTHTAVANWEAGRRTPNPATLAEYVRLLDGLREFENGAS